MNISTKTITLGRYELETYTILPQHREAHTLCLFTHGQGDYTRRYSHHYPALFEMLTSHGYGILSTDLPGHGASSGKRGHADLKTIDRIHAHQLLQVEHMGKLPFAFCGHSMGGLLTLRRLMHTIQHDAAAPVWTWINCPLIDVAGSKPKWFITCSKIAAKVIPRFTIKTGVSPELCHSKPTKTEGHSPHRISLQWANDLFKMSLQLKKTLPTLRSDIPLLITQGGADKICSADTARAFFDRLALSNKHFELFADMPHEPFAEADNTTYLQSIESFLLRQDLRG